jgi:SAM-dependent MidA family methyltransferase
MDLRREPPRPLDDTSKPDLLAAIRDEIRRDGPMSFARFMAIALYDPTSGYYRSDQARPGREGDFLTAPEAHPIFGRAIARFAAAVHAAIGSPPAFAIREYGAGEGALAAPLVDALLDPVEPASPAPVVIRYLVDEVEPRRVSAVRGRIAALGAGASGRLVVESDDGAAIDGLAIANEVLDALPTARVVQRGDRLREVAVGLGDDDRLVDVERDAPPDLAARLAAEDVTLADGQRGEICLEVDRWMERAASGLQRGLLLVIDYGHPASELYDPRRRFAGTLATYQAHQVGEDPYRAIGRQDITAHVDVTAVERAAAAAGLTHLGTTTQATFLARLGAGELLVAEQTGPGATLQRYLEARSALVRMIDPAAMGGFRVLVFGRGLPADIQLPGLDQVPAQAAAPGRPSADD